MQDKRRKKRKKWEWNDMVDCYTDFDVGGNFVAPCKALVVYDLSAA